MKTKISVFTIILCFSLLSLTAQEKETKEFKVYGNCGMCEKRIETAAKSVEGVTSADWNKETKMISVSYDASNTNTKKIQMTIAEVGHDTEMYTADNDVYNKLPGCCKYERLDSKNTENKNLKK